MKKTGLIIGSIEITSGIISLAVISMTQQLITKLARMCFMFNTGSFSESDYMLNTSFADTVSLLLCIVGIVTIIYFCFIKKEQ